MNREANQDLALSIGRLQIALGKLRGFQPKSLSEVERKQRTATMKRLRNIIEALTNRELHKIAGGTTTNIAELDAATARLQEGLANLQEIMQIIGVIAAGIDVITGVLKLASPVNAPN